jgi:hypothetical protein
MADRELIAAIILAGLLARNTGASADDLAPSAIEAADKLRAALEGSPKLSGPVGFTSQNDDEPPPGTPWEKTKTDRRTASFDSRAAIIFFEKGPGLKPPCQ